MALRSLTVRIANHGLTAVPGCRINIELVRAGKESGSLVIPDVRAEKYSNDSGLAVFELWPNDGHSRYHVKIYKPAGSKVVEGFFDMPDHDESLDAILAFADSGPVGGGPSGVGWTPVFSIESYGETGRVQKVINWTGGTGQKPPVNVYVSTTGFTTEISQAVIIGNDLSPDLIQLRDEAQSAAESADNSSEASSTSAGASETSRQASEAAKVISETKAGEASSSALSASGSATSAGENAGIAVSAKDDAEAARNEVQALIPRIDAIEDGQAAGQIVKETWTLLSAITGSAGQGAQVINDAGTHTDPVVGGTVANAGQYVWSASPAGWKWVRADGLSLKADKTVIQQTAGDQYLYGQKILGKAFVGTTGRVGLGIAEDGTLLGKFAVAGGYNLSATFDPSTGYVTLSLGNSEGEIPFGSVSSLREVGDIFIGNDKVVYGWKDTNGRWPLWVGDDGVVHAHGIEASTSTPVSAIESVDIWGDSLSAPSQNTTAWQTATGLPTNNYGIGGQQSLQISARAGGYVSAVTVGSNTISSGSNSITAFDGAAIATTSGAWSAQILSTPSDGTTRTLKGRIQGVLGTMQRSTASGAGTTETYTFTPDAGQTVPVYCPAGSLFIVETPVASNALLILAMGRNDADWSNISDIIAKYQALVDRALEQGNKHFVILTPPNGNYASERRGQSRHTQLLALENAIMRQWPQNTYVPRRWLIDKGLAALGITPVSQDTTDIADDTVPASLRSDNVHWITSVYAPMVADIISTIITPKAWLS